MAEQGRFGPADARLLETIAATVGIAIQNAQLFRDAGRRFDEMAALVEVAREISATLDPRVVLERMAERAQTLLEVDTSAVYLANEDGRSFKAIVALGERGGRDPRRHDPARRGDHRRRGRRAPGGDREQRVGGSARRRGSPGPRADVEERLHGRAR